MTGADEALSVEAAFAWRLLHRAFLLDNGSEFADFFTRITLPANANDLDLGRALHVLYAGAVSYTHLDVYKRQPRGRGARVQEGG